MLFGSGSLYGGGFLYAGASGGSGSSAPPATVTAAEKHDSFIAYAFQYRDEKGDLIWEKHLVTYDADLVAHVRSISVDIKSDGEVIPYFKGDEDSVRVYFEIALNATASDPTTGSSYVDDQSGAPASTGVYAKYGDRISIKARAVDWAGVLGPVLPKVFVRGDTEATAPTFQVRASRTAGVVSIAIEGQDPTASMTAWDFTYRFPDGAGGYNTASNSTSFTTNNWNTGDRTFSSTLDITVPKGVSGDVYFRATHLDEMGVSREKGFSVHLSDIDEVNKTVRIPGSALIPADDQTLWNGLSSKGLMYPSAIGAHPWYSYHHFVAPVILADAVEIDEVYAYGRRSGASDYLEVALWQTNTGSGAGRVSAGIYFPASATASVQADSWNPINWTVDYSTEWFTLHVAMVSTTNPNDSYFGYAEIRYTAYSYEATF